MITNSYCRNATAVFISNKLCFGICIQGRGVRCRWTFASVPLSRVSGVFTLLADLHDSVPPVSFTSGGLFGYAITFTVHAAGATAFGGAGLPGETVAAVISMFVGRPSGARRTKRVRESKTDS